MHSFLFHETKQHGTIEFPAEYYYEHPASPSYQMTFHWHKEWELVRIIEGSFEIHVDEEIIAAKAGDIILLRDSMMHGGMPTNCIYDGFLFDLHGLYRNYEPVKKSLRPIYRMEILPDVYYPKDEHPELYTYVAALMDAYANKTLDIQELIALGCLSQIFAYILKNHLYTASHTDTLHHANRIGQISSVLEYIEHNYQASVTLDNMADVAGMNPKYFCRIFKAITHQSPMEYVIFYRIEQAANLLSTTDLPITEIAMECGFNDCSYFIRKFKNLKHTTPYKYRSKNLQNPTND